jgi:hypothetical protein
MSGKAHASEKTIRNRIKAIRKCLDEINGEVLSINYEPIQDFEGKANYPMEFQLFMEEIGQTYINMEQGLTGRLVLTLETPQPLVGLGVNNVYALDNFQDEEDFEGQKAKDVVIFANDVHAQLYGFDKTHLPYFFISSYITRDVEDNFLDWFVGFINDELDENRYIDKEIRMKYRLI